VSAEWALRTARDRDHELYARGLQSLVEKIRTLLRAPAPESHPGIPPVQRNAALHGPSAPYRRRASF
jgi:hypothetical protein